MWTLILSNKVYLEFVVQEFDHKIIRNMVFFLEDLWKWSQLILKRNVNICTVFTAIISLTVGVPRVSQTQC